MYRSHFGSRYTKRLATRSPFFVFAVIYRNSQIPKVAKISTLYSSFPRIGKSSRNDRILGRWPNFFASGTSWRNSGQKSRIFADFRARNDFFGTLRICGQMSTFFADFRKFPKSRKSGHFLSLFRRSARGPKMAGSSGAWRTFSRPEPVGGDFGQKSGFFADSRARSDFFRTLRNCGQMSTFFADFRKFPKLGRSRNYQKILFASGHTATNTPDLFRTPKLTVAGPGQYWGGGPPGKSFGCC